MSDKYDDAVAYLTAHPREIRDAWDFTHNMDGGILFQHCTPRGFPRFLEGEEGRCGCLTEVAAGARPAFTPALTLAIRADDRIPKSPDDITVDDLPVFAEWQRKLDAAIRKTL